MIKTSRASVNIAIDQFSFSPSYVVAKPGTKIVWKNKNGVAHIIQSTPSGYIFMSSVIRPGESFSFTVPNNSDGIYNYACAIYPSMKGKIVIAKKELP